MIDFAERHGASPRIWPALRVLRGGRFSRKAQARVLVLFEQRRIAYSTVYPLLMHRSAFARRFGAEIRLWPTERALTNGIPAHLQSATHVVTQTWLTDPPERLDVLRARLAELSGTPRLVYLDSFANSDIRFAARLPEMDLYYKKGLLRNRVDLLRETTGHTVALEYYGKLYDIPQETVQWGVPESYLPKLRLAPNFLTSPELTRYFMADPPGPQAGRDIDLHARLGGTDKDNCYGEMRRQAEARAQRLTDLNVTTGTGLPKPQFMDELRRSRLCFSPFGYGELCWRDIEAFATGAILLKPDMSHIDTAPDLYRDGDTYVALNWDFSDLEETVHALLADPERAEHIAHTAWQACRDYLAGEGPVDTYADIFASG